MWMAWSGSDRSGDQSAAATFIGMRSWQERFAPDGIITDAIEMQRIYLEQFGTRSACIAYGSEHRASTNPDVVRQYGLEPFEYYLIASRLVPENNADLIVRGFERLRTNRLLAIAGDANYRSAFVDALKQTRDPRVRFLGHVGNSDHVKELHCNCYGYIHGHSVGGTNPALLKAFGLQQSGPGAGYTLQPPGG